MNDRICPFSATMAKAIFACRHAKQIIRRGGTEFACDSADIHTSCEQLLRHFKDTALPEFGVADDLTQVPHGTLVKIQFGGLLGLQRITSGTESQAVADIAGLVDSATGKFGSVDAIPCQSLCDDMLNYKLSRRGRR